MRGIASFIAGFGNGYFKAEDKKYERERQQKLDAQANELHTAKMSEILATQDERQRERDFREANVAALSTGKTDTGQVVTDAAGSNAYTKDADAAAVLQDMAQTANGGAQVAPATRVLTGMQGATQRGTIPGQQVFTDPAKAQEFAQSMPMTEFAKLKARKDVAEQYGKLEIADDMRGKLENLASKGVFKAGSLLDAGNADGALKVLQDANPDLVPKGAQFKQVDVPDMFDRSKTVKGWALVAPGAEGQPERVLVGDFRDAVFGYLTPEKQFDAKRALASDARTAERDKVHDTQWQKKFDQDAAQNKEARGLQARQIAIAEAEAARKKQVFEQESKLPDPVKRSYAALEAQAKAMDSAMYKAMADGTWQPGSPGAEKMSADRVAVSMRMQKLLSPYMGGGSSSESADPLGIRAPATSGVGNKTESKPVPKATMQQTVASSPGAAYSGGRPATMQSFFGASGGAQAAAEPSAVSPQPARSPQSLGDDFASPAARSALTARVQEAANGGAPLTEIETLRARQLKLL